MKGNEENRFFKKALSDFTFDVSCGAAIRHLMELGYSVEQIHDRLDYPMSIEKIQAYMDKRTAEINGSPSESYEMILEYDEYGHRSYRKVRSKEH